MTKLERDRYSCALARNTTMNMVRTAKEITRDLIAKAGLGRLHVSVRKLKGENVDHLFRRSLSERFSAIYANRVWLNGRSAGSESGFGSDLQNTESVRNCLATLLESLHTRCLLDIGCGDFIWMKEVSLPCRYVGVDIVQKVIEANDSLYRSERRSFLAMDATRDPLPRADTILCREVLFHLSFRDIRCLLANVQKSGSSFFVATNDDGLSYNADILSGDFRMLNLHKSPLYFPKPLHSIPDDGILPDRKLSVWRVSDLPVSR
jgi:hypothetical protein